MDLDPMSSPQGTGTFIDSLRDNFTYWSDFVDRCIRNRLDTDRFRSFARLVYKEHPLPPTVIAELFLRPQPNNCYSLDPRVPPYLQVLTDLEYLDTPAILKALYKHSSSHNLVESQSQGQSASTEGQTKNDDGNAKPLRWKSSFWVEEAMFFRMVKALHEGQAVQDTTTALEVVKIVSKWLALFTRVSSAFATDLMAQSHSLQMEMESSRAAFVAVLLRLTDNHALLKAIGKPQAKSARKEFSESLANFIPILELVNAGTDKAITEKLAFFRTEVLVKLDPVDEKKQAADAAMNDMLDSAVGLDTFEVRDVPIITTRVSMYIHLNAALVGRPLVDDASFYSFVTNRYGGDSQTAAIDLILASFDVLANAIFRNGGKEDAQLLKSFLINKVPLLLCQIFPPGFPTPQAELCITNALSQVDTSLFPTPSLMFDESRNNNPYTESVREEFCAACVLHGLVNKDRMEHILGEMSMSYDLGKKSKDKLIQDYQLHIIKGQDLLSDLEKTDGNVGAVCHAFVDIIRRLCIDKDTMSLKILCTEIVQKPQTLDILLLFETVPNIIGPLCQLLENWRYEDDQAEYQPVYEEFGAILLLVLAFTNRYGLKPSDIGLYNPKSTVRKIISQAHVNRGKDQLTEQEDKHLNGWILGLFDSEGGGLGDDLMSSCPPQDFYLVVAPLFYSIVVGYSHGYISDDSLKGGVEYLVDTFLLPSLVPAIKFLTDYLWVDQKEQKAIIKILQLILLPSAISSEASAMLASVKKIVAKPLENALRTYLNKRDPRNQDIQPLLDALKDSAPLSRRTGWADMSEITEWSKTEPSGLWSCLKNTTLGLVQWSMQPAVNVIPITYTHRQFIIGIKMLSPQRVLRLILEEVRSQTRTDAELRTMNEQQLTHQNQIAGVVTDVAVALICAPNVTNEPPAPNLDTSATETPTPQRLLTLVDVLKLEAERCREIQKTDPMLAEIIVRLHRRVEAQMTMPQAQPVLLAPSDMQGMGMTGTDIPMNTSIAMPDDLNMGDTMNIGDGMGMTGGAEVSLGDMTAMDDGGMGLDLNLDAFGDDGKMGGLDGGVGGDDLFNMDNLDGGMDVDWDNIDLGGM